MYLTVLAPTTRIKVFYIYIYLKVACKIGDSIDDLKLETAYAHCDEIHSAQLLEFEPSFMGMFYTCTFTLKF